MLTHTLFTEYPDVLRKYAEHFRYVLVDEYQDTNYVQQCIVLQLTREHRRVCVVGDDAQSIYGFRGADIDNILDFQTIYEEAKLFKLEQNYRSTQRIVQAANSLIKHNGRQIHKDVFSRNDEGENSFSNRLIRIRRRPLLSVRRSNVSKLWSDVSIATSPFSIEPILRAVHSRKRCADRVFHIVFMVV